MSATVIWTILVVFLSLLAIAFIIAWAITYSDLLKVKNCSSEFGITNGKDGNAISRCGTTGNQPCVYQIATFAGAQQQCNLLSSICDAFIYQQGSGTMKIVNLDSVFDSSNGYLFVRQ